MNKCLLCNNTITNIEEGERLGYFYNYFKYKSYNLYTLVCSKCHIKWYYKII